MKKIFFLVVFFLVSHNVMAKTIALFSYNPEHVESALLNATVLDNYVTSKHVSADQLNTENPLLINFKADDNLPALSSDSPLGIPGFCWGFVFGVLGILIVYLVSEDKHETQNALMGCVISYVLGIGCYFLVYAGAAASSTSTTY